MFLAEVDVPWAYFIQASGAQSVFSIFQHSAHDMSMIRAVPTVIYLIFGLRGVRIPIL